MTRATGRRSFLKAGLAAAAVPILAACGGAASPTAAPSKPAASPAAGPGPAKPGAELKIIQWSHFVPAYDDWFNKKYVVEWGQTNNVKVTVDNINQADHPARTAAEASSKSGHDIFDWF